MWPATTTEYRSLGSSSVFNRGLLARRFMAQMAQKYQRPIWLTEFACGLAGSIQILTQVMKSMLTMLDNQPMVARCAQLHHTPRRAGADMMANLCGAKMMVFTSTVPALGDTLLNSLPACLMRDHKHCPGIDLRLTCQLPYLPGSSQSRWYADQ